MDWYHGILLGLLLVPIALSLLGVGTPFAWIRYFSVVSISFLGWAGESCRVNAKSESISAFNLAFCAFVGGLVAEEIARRKGRF